MNDMGNENIMDDPYLIEIVPVDRGWILETMAKAIEREAEKQPERFRVQIVNQPTDQAELTFFLPESAYRPLVNSTTVTYLAHKEDHRGAAALFSEVARKSDYCITSSLKYQEILKKDGAKEVFKVHLGVDTEMFKPKLRLGVVGRTYHTGRKGEALLAEIAVLPMVELRFTGQGWPHPANYYSTEDLVNFYRDLDYLLIPSLIEGGPVPLLEALSTGCPVIAPSDIGLVEDFPHIPFKRGDAKDLCRVVKELLQQKLLLREKVINCDWKNFAQHHLNIFRKIIDNRRQARSKQSPLNKEIEKPVRVLLVTHGLEDIAKGGPSSRVNFIVAQLQAAGHQVESIHNIRSVNNLANFDVVHVFNSWPPQTALECMALAKKASKVVVFSPIALDLADWPIYRQLMECVFATGKPDEVESVIKQLPKLAPSRCYFRENTVKPFEGIPNHFEALRQCCALADHLVFLSNYEKDFLSALGVVNTECGVLIHNGVSNVFNELADPDLFRKRHGFDRYVLCVGRIEYRKNQALLAMAMRDLDIPLVLIGDEGDAGYLEHVRQLGGTNLYHFSRLDDKALLASAYAGASVFILPSWCEGASLSAIEAGLVGTPLILSDRSSEKEYFGVHADYISPANPDSMKAAIVRTLAKTESMEERAARISYIQANYSGVEHVHKTLELYRKVSKRDHAHTKGDLVIDVSSLLHYLRIGGHLTGVPLAERNIITELVAMKPDARCIAYNDLKGRFIEIPYRDIESFDPDTFNRLYWFSDSEYNGRHDVRLELSIPQASDPPQILPGDVNLTNGKWGWAYWAARQLTRLGLPHDVIRKTGRYIKMLSQTIILQGLSRVDPRDRVHATSASIDFSDVNQYLTKSIIPRSTLYFAPKSRILTIGQSWLSNEPLLDRMIEIVTGHSLEPYVYDISYVSGAHFSGWEDNEDRRRRLTKILRHSSTVFTESRIVETELSKFASSRSMAFNIVRTGLRGKEVPALRKSTFSNNYSPFVLYVSSFNRRKNHDFIVEVWKDIMSIHHSAEMHGVNLLLVGEIQGESKYSEPEYQDNLRRFNIKVINNATDDVLSQLYDQCLFTIYPSLQEGWGIPIQESLMHGKVCLSSDTVPAACEINNAAIIKIVPNKFFDWREAIISWATNERMRFAFEAEAAKYETPSWNDIALSIIKRKSIH